MQLALTKDEAAFRDELREIYTTKIPAEIRQRSRSGEGLNRDDIAGKTVVKVIVVPRKLVNLVVK